MLALGAVALPVVVARTPRLAARPSTTRSPCAALELAAGLLRARAVVVHVGRFAVLVEQLHDQVDVIVAGRVLVASCRAAVPDRQPPLGAEPHLADELLGELLPLLVAERRLVGVQAQRAVPHVRVGADLLAALIDQHVAFGVAPADGDARSGPPPRRVEMRGQLGRRRRVVARGEVIPLPCAKHSPVARDQVRVGVLVALARPD